MESAFLSRAKATLMNVRGVVNTVRYRGEARYCPICLGSFSQFLAHGNFGRPDARCPKCGAAERHRLVWLYFNEKTDLFDGRNKTMLHVAPELALGPLLKKRLGNGYLSADIFSPRAMVKMDITDIQYPDQSFDVIFCSHVLEHVKEDMRAMREFARVLKDDGWAILAVPTGGVDKIYEDWSITGEEDRLREFGHRTHVRRYSKAGFVERLETAGLSVDVLDAPGLYADDERKMMGLTPPSGYLFRCTKTAPADEGVKEG